MLQLAALALGVVLVIAGVAMVSVPLALVLSGASCIGSALYLLPETLLRKGGRS